MSSRSVSKAIPALFVLIPSARAVQVTFDPPAVWLGPQAADGSSTYNTDHVFVADFDGDGLEDLLYRNTGWHVARSTGSTFSNPVIWLPDLGPGGIQNYHSSPDYQAIVDLNGDGLADYFFNYTGWRAALSDGTAFQTPQLWLPDTASDGSITSNPTLHHSADFDGDGKTDFLYWDQGWRVVRSTGTGFTAPSIWLPSTLPVVTGGTPVSGAGIYDFVADLNGDGKADYFFRSDYGNWYGCLSTGSSFLVPTQYWIADEVASLGPPGQRTTYSTGGDHQFVADFTGDGKADYLYRRDWGNWYLFRSTGTGFDAPLQWLPEVHPNVLGNNATHSHFGLHEFAPDFNSDGRSDFMFLSDTGATSNNHWYVCLSNGSGFVAPALWMNGAQPGIAPTGVAWSASPRSEFVADLDGGGDLDFLLRPDGGASSWYVARGPGAWDVDGDLIANVVDNCPIVYNPLQEDCDGDGIGDACSADCDSDGIPDVCEILAGAADCDGNGIPDICQPDCDSDGLADACEILAGAGDCDANGIPDACQPDCDLDGTADVCEIIAGAPDCNGNGYLDTCDPFLPAILAYAAGSPNSAPTTGGVVIQLVGVGLPDPLPVELRIPGRAPFLLGPSLVAMDATHTLATITLPPVAPGCDCAGGAAIPADMAFYTTCGTLTLSGAGLGFQYTIAQTLVTNPAGLQSAIDSSPEGACLMLVPNVNYAGPILVPATKHNLTLTTQDLASIYYPRIQGLGSTGGPPPALPALRLIGSTAPESLSGVCLRRLNMQLGNTGLEIVDCSPVVRQCHIDDNRADVNHGGGVTIHSTSLPAASVRPILIDCTIRSNKTLGEGGGIRVVGAAPAVMRTQIDNNTTTVRGGALYLIDTAPGTVFVENSLVNCPPDDASTQERESLIEGGGVFWNGSSTSSVATGAFARNIVEGNVSTGPGAGIHLGRFVQPTIANNTIRGNRGLGTASRGGGLFVAADNSNPFDICENVLTANEAQIGGAIAILNKSKVHVRRNLVYCNLAVQRAPPPEPNDPPPPPAFAGGLYVTDAAIDVVHNTFYLNRGIDGIGPYQQAGGVHAVNLGDPHPFFWNNVFNENEGCEFYSDTPLNSALVTNVEYNLAWDPADAPTQLFLAPSTTFFPLVASPLFRAPSCTPCNPWGGFGLAPNSPAVGVACDQGNLGAVLSSAFQPRHCPPSFDCTADGLPVVADQCNCPGTGDCNGNFVPDSLDILAGTSPDADQDGVPDECQSTPIERSCFGDGTGLDCPCSNCGAAGAGCPNSVTTGSRLDATGNATVAEDTFLLQASALPATTSCLFFQGTALEGGGGVVFGDGVRCAGGAILRLGTKTASGGRATYPAGLDARISIRGQIPATGGTRHYQTWYRNAALGFCPPATFNAGNMVSVTWMP